jgi:hypothetical protein
MEKYFRLSFYGAILVFAAFLSMLVVSCKNNQVEQPQPAVEVKLKKITYSDSDFQTFSYNDAGKITKYTSQWQFVQNDPTQIKKLNFDFLYDATGNLIRVNTTGGGYIKYYYKNNILEKTEEIDAKDRVQTRRTYTFTGNNLTEEYWETNLVYGDKAEVKVVFDYDNIGNLIKETTSIPDSITHNFVPNDITEYSGFDSNPKTDNLLMRYPHLPAITLQKNNPAKKVFKTADGKIIFTENYTYQYDEKGVPVKKVREIIYPGTPAAQLIGTFDY